LQDADLSSRDAVAFAAKLGSPALIPYSILVSLRIMVAKSLVDFNGHQEVYRNFAGELRGHVATARTGYMSYRQTLLPANRLTDFQCGVRDQGGQFPIRMYGCTFKVDGQVITAETASPGGNADSAMTAQALQTKAQREQELLEVLLKIDREIGGPLLAAADEWELIANDIVPGVISLSNTARGRVPKPGQGGLSVIRTAPGTLSVIQTGNQQFPR
jgi:hypothetical protein